MSSRRTNEPSPLEVEPSTAGATGDDEQRECLECGEPLDRFDTGEMCSTCLDIAEYDNEE